MPADIPKKMIPAMILEILRENTDEKHTLDQKDILEMDSSQIVTMHIQSVDQNKAIKTVKHTITELDRSKIEEQKKENSKALPKGNISLIYQIKYHI